MAQSWNYGQQGWSTGGTPQPGWQHAGQPQQPVAAQQRQAKYTAGEQRYLEMLRQQEELQQQQMQQYWAQQIGVGGSAMQGSMADASQGAWGTGNAQRPQQQSWQYQPPPPQMGMGTTPQAPSAPWQPPPPARPAPQQQYQQQQAEPPPLPTDPPPGPQTALPAGPGQHAPPLPSDGTAAQPPTSAQGWQAWPGAQQDPSAAAAAGQAQYMPQAQMPVAPPHAAGAAAPALADMLSGPPGWQPAQPMGVGPQPGGARPQQWGPQQQGQQSWGQQQQQQQQQPYFAGNPGMQPPPGAAAAGPPPLPAQPPLPVEAPPGDPLPAPTVQPMEPGAAAAAAAAAAGYQQQHPQQWGGNMPGYGMTQQAYGGYPGYAPYPPYHAGYGAAAAATAAGGGGVPAPGGTMYPMHGQPAAQVPAGPAGLAPAAAAAPTAAPAPEAAQQPVVQQKVQLRSLLLRPGRHKRPPRLLLVLRGLPGSGKSHLARKIKEVEVEQGGSAPRVHSIDDYFMTEVEEEGPKRPGTKRPAAGVPEQEYQYDPDMEETYRRALVKAAAKSMEGGSFPLLVVDAPHARAEHLREVWVAGQKAGYEVVVVEPLCSDPQACHKRNVHKRSLRDIQSLQLRWEDTPATYTIAAAASLLDGSAAAGDADDGTGLIKEVDMEGDEQQREPPSSKDSPQTPAGTANASSPSRSAAAAATGDVSDDDEEGTPAAATLQGGSRWGGLEPAQDAAAAERAHKKRKKSAAGASASAGADSWNADDFDRLERQLAELEEGPAAAGGQAGAGSSRGGPSSSSGKPAAKSILKQTPGSSAKKVRWPDEPNASSLPPGEGFRMAAEPQQLEEVFWVSGLGPRYNSWTGSDEEEEEALGAPAWAAALGATPAGLTSLGGSSAAGQGGLLTAKVAPVSGGVGGVGRKSFAEQVLAEHSQERASMKTHNHPSPS